MVIAAARRSLVLRELIGRRIVRSLFNRKRTGYYFPVPPIRERYGNFDFARPDTLRGSHGAVERIASAALVEDRFDGDGRLAGFLVRKLEDRTRMEVLGHFAGRQRRKECMLTVDGRQADR